MVPKPTPIEFFVKPVLDGWQAVVLDIDEDGSGQVVTIVTANTRKEALKWARRWCEDHLDDNWREVHRCPCCERLCTP